MNRNTPAPDTTSDDHSWESDAVWKLLEQSPTLKASDRFAEDTVRAARLLVEVKPWWSRLFSPARLTPIAGLAGATAAVIFGVISWNGPTTKPSSQLDSAQAVAIQDVADTETLIAAADHLEAFSDRELVSLIGF